MIQFISKLKIGYYDSADNKNIKLLNHCRHIIKIHNTIFMIVYSRFYISGLKFYLSSRYPFQKIKNQTHISTHQGCPFYLYTGIFFCWLNFLKSFIFKARYEIPFVPRCYIIFITLKVWKIILYIGLYKKWIMMLRYRA